MRSASQASNVDVLSTLAVTCLSEVETMPSALSLTAPTRLPFLRSALVESLRSDRVVVYEAGTEDIARLDVDLQRAGVAYARSGGGSVARTVSVSLALRLVDPAGAVLHDSPCLAEETDRVPRNLIPSVQDQTYPETRAEVPLSRWRRAIQPAIVTAATVAGTVLFFSLRSRRSESG